jgi:hypothetical protein
MRARRCQGLEAARVNDEVFAVDFGRQQIPRSAADAARIAAMGASLVLTGHLTRFALLLCEPGHLCCVKAH